MKGVGQYKGDFFFKLTFRKREGGTLLFNDYITQVILSSSSLYDKK